MSKDNTLLCSCGSGLIYQACCAPFHQGMLTAETAEKLMRSRFSAFALGKPEYLRSTWVKEQCPDDLSLDNRVKWIKLEIVSSSERQVEFKAWFIEADMLYCLHEISAFERHGGRWLYHSGQIIEEPTEALTMNRLCPCESGQKFKRCCR